MTILAEMTRIERFDWLERNTPSIEAAREKFMADLREYAGVLESAKGAFERDGMTAASFTEQIMNYADAPLADEVKRDLRVE